MGTFPPFDIEVKNFYHNGMGRFASEPKLGAKERGRIEGFPIGGYGLWKTATFIHQLLDSKADFMAHQAEFGLNFSKLSELLIEKVEHMQRLSYEDGYLPNYAPADDNDLTIKILGPILESYATDKKGLRYLSSKDSITSNGHSIILRLDYKDVKILLAGDLNRKSQQLILSYLPKEEFAVDVAKACHHGAEDILFDFMQAVQAKVTVISSGDNENYSHPRPLIIGASGFYGSMFKGADDKLYPPLVYSTELARSTQLKFAEKVRVRDGFDDDTYDEYGANHTLIKAKGEGFKKLKFVPINTDLIFGLVSVRTDGQTIMVATREEIGKQYDIKIIKQ